ncbi:uncharacterized protein LOC120699098 isoform X2 [Panicum virgatum]|uniref:uncharacterized protein LOC120699098 isoform X2 n=1 Tax=Panicum virgatum TaxID=38727 RepID=UPI0019D50455|nr:uncharacterized protein LOC120699098 isoform X2 [Panicum virgatum]
MEESCTSPPPSRDLAGGRTHARRRAAAPRACRGCLPVPLLRLPAPRPSAAAAKLKTLKPLQDAVEAPCPLAADCGSCMTKSLAYAAQIRHKHHQGRDTPRPACTPTSLPPTGSSMAPAPWPTAPRSAARRPADVLCCRRAALAGQRHYASRCHHATTQGYWHLLYYGHAETTTRDTYRYHQHLNLRSSRCRGCCCAEEARKE